MLLKKVSIRNFKSIKHFEFDFPESNTIVLVGELQSTLLQKVNQASKNIRFIGVLN